MMFGRGFGYGYGSYLCGGVMPVMLVLAILLVGIVIYFIFKNQKRKSTAVVTGSQALTILNERLAKGEITQEEYEKIKKIISH